MIAFYCITVSGLLLSLQYRAQRAYDERLKPTPRQIEKMLDEENERLDCELVTLLAEHRRLSEGRAGISDDMTVTPEMRRRFDELEAEVKKGREDAEG